MINSQQRIRLVTQFQRTGSIGMSALKSGMDRKTARKYLKHPERLGEPRPAREWRTRVDPLAAIWQVAEPRLRVAPELEAKSRAGLQAALFRLGKVPKLLQIDNSSAATHQISGEGKRDFNPEFLSLVAHYGLTPRTIHVRLSE